MPMYLQSRGSFLLLFLSAGTYGERGIQVVAFLDTVFELVFFFECLYGAQAAPQGQMFVAM